MTEYLARLNPEQREAVETVDGPLLVLAGAGTGKTRVLTTRFAHILLTGRAAPGQVLAVTFTNKAAKEMRERVGTLLGRPAEGLWLGTFHALCARMLRRHAELVGLTSGFTILDSDDQLRLLKQVMEAAHIDPKRWAPPALMGMIQRWKDRGLTPERVTAAEEGDFAGGQSRTLYAAYQTRLKQLNTADFGDLLLHMTEILRSQPEILADYHRRFHYILVDEYQDTNLVQYMWLRLLAQSHKNICCVGDDDQCLAAGTPVTLADGSQRPIQAIQAGDMVLACHGDGAFRPARVTDTYARRSNRALVRLHLADGRDLLSTPEHGHFADVLPGEGPQGHYTYLMQRAGQFRVGTSPIHVRGQDRPVIGYKQRLRQEKADAIWLVSAFGGAADALEFGHLLSLRYGITTLPFVARTTPGTAGLADDQSRLDRIHAAQATSDGPVRLMQDHGLDPDRPHCSPRIARGPRRHLVTTLFTKQRGAGFMHRVTLRGDDPEGLAALHAAGLEAGPSRRDPSAWRCTATFADMAGVHAMQSQLAAHLPVTLTTRANLLGLPLTLRPASQVRPGMMMAGADGRHHAVTAVGTVDETVMVHDLNIEGVHNFVANGIVTHNSIYSWRGAEVENILRFEKDFPGAQIVKLERNYRSTAPILAAAAGLIANNEGRIGKTLRSGRNDAQGEQVNVISLWDSDEEARMVGDRIERLRRDGHKLAECAILVRTSAQTRAFEERMITLGIPYRVIGGLRFYERAEIRDAIAYMRILHQPADDLAFERIVNVPRRGVGDVALRSMHIAAREQQIPLAQAAERLAVSGALKGRIGTAMEELFQSFARWREALPRDGHVLVLATMLDESGYTDMWKADKSPDAPGRLENLKELVRALADFETLAGFLDHVSLVMENEQNAEGDRASMMTLHAAKGLEFDTVFLPGWEEGLFPSQRTLDEGGLKGLEEERRLAYVGLTRARKLAVVSYAANRRLYANWQSSIPSRFVDELPEAEVVRAGSAAMQRETRLMSAPSVFTNGPLAARRPKVIEAWEQPARPVREDVFTVGTRVFHQKFGYGQVAAVDDHKLTIDFEQSGQKHLMSSFVQKVDQAGEGA
jgi:DNA helicase-2/ATP-dependent DNA helicase PcrA